MKNLIDAVELYLKTSETDYAILIKGEWGCGKTYFYKNILSKKIKELGYKPVYVSLFGIGNSNELSRRLFLELNPKIGSLLKSKAGKIAELTKSVLGSVSFYGVGIKPDFSKIDLEKWISLRDNYLLCFDDLERTNFQISEVLGFINSFIEHDKCKVLFISDENRIEKKDSYWTFKEKVVGYSIEYIPDIENVFTTICESFKQDRRLQLFLAKHKTTLFQMLRNRNLHNIRILKHALQSYKFIHNHLIEAKKESLNDFGVRLLLFTVAVSYAVKSENDAIREELKKLTSTEDFRLGLYFSDGKAKKSELKEFYERFYDPIQYEIFFSRSVLEYILNGFFKPDMLEQEIKAEIGEVENPITKSIRTLFYEWFNLEDGDLESLTRNVLDYVRKGKISINLYPTIFSFFSHFSKQRLVKEDVVSLAEIFKQGLNKAYELTSYDGMKSLSIQEPLADSELPGEYAEIKKMAEQYISQLEEDWLRKKVDGIFELIPEHMEEFSRRLLEEKEHYWSKPVFKYYSMDKLFEKLKQANNKARVNFRSLLHHRYRGILSMQEVISGDAENLRGLSELIKSYSAGGERKLSIVLLEKIGKTAQECSEVLSKYKKSTCISTEEQK